ncbi:MAG: cytochrome c oxidase subunit 3 family protein [Chloroflexaceae bacterium]|jgi:cytochrome c oxidase subunit 3|nr:cytochrome c oxidase subunit 3 family protein [Chloroflexaceae bacterium]
MAQHNPAVPTQHSPHLAHHFDTLEQQYDAANAGMWLFLATEIMLFGALFVAYAVYRFVYPETFFEASRHLAIPAESPWYLRSVFLGTINTTVLLVSSLTMALAVHAAQTGKRNRLVWLLLATMVLGTVFLGIKGLEYFLKYEEHLIPGPNFIFEQANRNQAQLFFLLYFIGTGLHAVHMVIGLGLLAYLVFQSRKGRFTPEWFTPVEMGGLYWHFVDVVWVFLFPLFYLIGLHE